VKYLVIGSPGSGKTKFANKKAKQEDLKVIDNLAKKYQEKNDLSLGRLSDYRVDVMFACHVLEVENKNKNSDFIITCGPLYTLCHLACKVKFMNDNDKIDKIFWVGNFLNRLVLDSLWYDEIYYLPYKGNDEYNIIFDESIRSTFKDIKIEKRITTVE
jgi:hypothetical protein